MIVRSPPRQDLQRIMKQDPQLDDDRHQAPKFPLALWQAGAPPSCILSATNSNSAPPFSLVFPEHMILDKAGHMLCEARKCLQFVCEYIDKSASASGATMDGFKVTYKSKSTAAYCENSRHSGQLMNMRNPAFFGVEMEREEKLSSTSGKQGGDTKRRRLSTDDVPATLLEDV